VIELLQTNWINIHHSDRLETNWRTDVSNSCQRQSGFGKQLSSRSYRGHDVSRSVSFDKARRATRNKRRCS